MGRTQAITGPEIAGIMSPACQGRAPVSACIHYQNRCLTYTSRLLSLAADRFVIEAPAPVDGQSLEQASAGEGCFLSFRYREFRYFLVARVKGPSVHVDKEGRQVAALDMSLPDKIDRQDRRAFLRVDVPTALLMRASVWSAPDRFPIWSGRVLNLSAGGLQLRTSNSAMGYFEPGDRVSVSLLLTPTAVPIEDQAYISYCAGDGEMAILGLALVGLDVESTAAQRHTRDVIAAKVAELSHGQ